MNKGAYEFRIWKACGRKRAFDSPEAAFQKGQTTYRCPHCGKWHRSSGISKLVNQVRTHRL